MLCQLQKESNDLSYGMEQDIINNPKQALLIGKVHLTS